MSVKEFLSDVTSGHSHFDSYQDNVITYAVPHYAGSPSSAAIYESNAEAIYERLDHVDTEHVNRSYNGRDVFVFVRDRDGKFTDAIKECVKIDAELSDYCIIDEDAYAHLRHEWCAAHFVSFEDEARELLERGDAAEIERRSEITVNGADLISDADRDEAIHTLAYALAETAFID